MRLSTNMIYHQRLQDMNNAQSRWMDAGSELASGKRVTKPSDDPQASSQAVRINQSETRNQQYVASRGFAKTGMTLQMSILSQMVDVTTQIDTTIIQASSQGGLSDKDRNTLAEQLTGLKEQLVGLGNTTDGNGRYIFAGFKSDKPPFEIDTNGDVLYQGGDKPIMQNVASDREMTSYFTGAQVFDTDSSSGSHVVNVFKALNEGIKALKVPQENASKDDIDAAQSALGQANSSIKSALDQISNIEAKQGLQLQEIDKLDFLADTRTIQNEQRKSELLDTNWAGTTTDYYKEKAMFEASQSIFKDLNSMSLFGSR